MNFLRVCSLTAFTLLTFSFVWHVVPVHNLFSQTIRAPFMTVSADDDEEEDEDDDEEEDEEEDESSQPKTVKVMKEVVEYRPVIEKVVITEEAYAKDTDGDLLVDALDPDPVRKQSEYFTDTDGDGVPNALDQHPNEDDFSYYESETDNNNNGIIDSYEG
jgi:hypothetical protein